MDSKFKTTQVPLAAALRQTSDAIVGETITLHDLLELAGQQGLLLFCIVLMVPFLLPVSIPGVSGVFGLVIIFIGIGLTLNRVPWLPAVIMRRPLQREQLLPTLEQGARLFDRVEHWIKPRLHMLTEGVIVDRLNGIAFILGGVFLMIPFSVLPFSNTLPALAVVLLSIGQLQRDGYFILGGYVMLIATFFYFAGLFLLTVIGGQALFSAL